MRDDARFRTPSHDIGFSVPNCYLRLGLHRHRLFIRINNPIVCGDSPQPVPILRSLPRNCEKLRVYARPQTSLNAKWSQTLGGVGATKTQRYFRNLHMSTYQTNTRDSYPALSLRLQLK